MRIGRALVVLAALMLVVSCGKPADQKAVEDSYNQLVDALEEHDGHAAFDLLSENTRDFMDQLAAAMTDMEIGAYEGGGDMLDEFLVGEGFAEFDRNIESVTIEEDVATLNTGTETLTFLKEGEAWRADLEGLIREGMEEGLEGTGITVEDILAGDLTGPGSGETGEGQSYETGDGSAPVTIVNGLGSWDIYFVYVDPSSAPWGDDRLGSDILLPGDEITVWVDPGPYDMQVEDEDGDTYTKWEIEVGNSGYEWEVTLADLDATGSGEVGLMPVPEAYTVGQGSAPVTFTNDLGGWDIYGVRIDPSSEPEWGEERLGAEYMLTGGQSVTVMVDPGTYDMQVIDEDEDTYTKWRSPSARTATTGASPSATWTRLTWTAPSGAASAAPFPYALPGVRTTRRA